MSIASKYINREIAAVFVVTLLMLLMVAVGGRFISYLQEAAMGKFSGSTVLTIIGLRLPEFVQLVAPFAIYIAIILSLGRLYADQEMVVLQSAGTSTSKVVSWVGLSLGAVTVIVAVLSLLITPLSQHQLAQFMVEQRSQSEFETLNAGIFHTYDRGNRVTYSEDMSDDRRVLVDVFLSQRLDDGRKVTLWAKEGRQETDIANGAQFLVLKDGKRYEGIPGEADFRIMRFNEMRQKLAVFKRGDDNPVEGRKLFSLGDDPESVAELHWRLAAPIFCFIGGIIGVGISRVKPRQGRFAKIVPGMTLMLVYYLALLITRNALAEGQIIGIMGFWPVHLLFAGAAVYLLDRVGKPVTA